MDFLPVCGECGEIKAGPEKGQKIPNYDPKLGHSTDEPQTGPYATHKGQRISHSLCDECARRMVYDQRARRAHERGI